MNQLPMQDKPLQVLMPANKAQDDFHTKLIQVVQNTPESGDAIDGLLQQILEHTGWTLIELWVPDIDFKDVRLSRYKLQNATAPVLQFVQAAEKEVFTHQQFASLPVWKGRQPCWYGNLHETTGLQRREQALKAGFNTAMAFPVLLNHETAGSLYFFDTSVKQYNQQLEKEIQEACYFLAAEIERKRVQKTFGLYFNSASEYLAIMSGTGRLKRVNFAFRSMLEEWEGDILDNTLDTWMHPADREEQAACLKRMLAEKSNGRFETRMASKSGREVCVSWSVTYVAEETYFLLAGRDITSEKNILRQLNLANEELRTASREVHDILSSINETFYKFSIQGHFLEAHESIALLTGYTPEELVGRLTFDYFHPDDADDVANAVMTGIREKRVVKDYLHRFRHKNGSWRWLSTSGRAVYDAGGMVAYIIGISQDVTEKLEKERLLKEQEIRYRRLFLSHPVPLLVVDWSNYTVTDVNNAAISHYGYTPEEFVGMSITKLRPPEDIPELEKRLAADREVMQPGVFLKAYWRHKKKNGDFFDAEVNYHVFELDGRPQVLSAITDITEKKKAEEALAESEQRYRLFIQNTSEAVFRYELTEPIPVHLDAATQLQLFWQRAILAECNAAVARRHGYENPADVTGRKLCDLYTVGVEENTAVIQAFIKSGYSLSNAEMRLLLPGGRELYLSNNLVGFVEKGYLVRVWGTSQDITLQKEFSRRNSYLASLVENVSDSIYSCNLNLEIISWNPAAEHIYGLKTADVMGKKMGNLLNISYAGYDREAIMKIIMEQGDWKGEGRFTRPTDGKAVTLLVSASLVKDEQGQPFSFVITGRDITERKEAEERLLQVEIEKQKLVNKASIEGQEKERQEISRELHDHVNQLISTAKLYMEAARRGDESQAEMIGHSVETLDMAIQEIRRLSKALTPPTLGNRGLNDAVADLVDDIHLAGNLRLHFTPCSHNSACTLPADVALTLYRIIQEQLNNIIKHSGASEAGITLQHYSNQVRLIISDNGNGFNPREKRKGVGLTNIINRASLHNGTVHIESAPGNGCVLKVVVPL